MSEIVLSLVLNRLLSDQPSWDRGDNLALLRLQKLALLDLGAALRYGLECFGHLSTPDRDRWGALLIAAGSLAFAAERDGPRTYETMGRVLGVQNLNREMGIAARLNAADRGARRHLGIQILRTPHARYFVETMVANSGLDLAVLEACAERVANAWNWSAVETSSLEEVERFIEARRNSLGLAYGRRAFLASAEGTRAVAHTLIELARFRKEALDRNAIGSTIKETRDAMGRAALQPAALIGVEPSDRLLELVLGIGKARVTESATPAFRWVSSATFTGLALTLPRRVALHEVTPEIDRVRISVVDGNGATVGSAADVPYTREGPAFRRTSPTPWAPLLSESALPLELMVRFRQGDEDHEISHSLHGLPGDPVTMFHAESGERVEAAPPGTRVVLACSPGWDLSPHVALESVSRVPLSLWRATIPRDPILLTTTHSSGEEAEWRLGSEPLPKIEPHGPNIEGLRLERALVFHDWPELRVAGFAGRAELEVAGPSGSPSREDVVCRNGRIRCTPRDEPGLYNVVLRRPGWKSRARFVIVPPDTRAEISEAGAEGVLASIRGIEALLTPQGPGATRVDSATVRFGPDIHGVQHVAVALPSLRLAGLWFVPVHPHRAVVRATQDGPPLPTPVDLSLCNDASVIELGGPPGGSVVLEVHDIKILRQIGSDGRRLVRFVEMPPELFDDDLERLTIRWSPTTKSQLQLIDPRRMRPTLRTNPLGVVYLQAKRELKPPVQAEIIRAARPWEAPERTPAAPVPEAGKLWYRFALPESLKEPLQVALVEEAETPVTGLALLPAPSPEAPPGAPPLTRLLWDHAADPSLPQLLRAAGTDVIERIASNVSRYGPSFFAVADSLPAAAGPALMRRFVSAPGAAEDGPLGRTLARMGYDLLVTTYDDVASLGPEIRALRDDDYVDLLDAIAARGAGLLMTALSKWERHVGNERFSDVIAPWAHIGLGTYAAITEDEGELIRTPPDAGERGAFDLGRLNPRAQGLVQARWAEVRLHESRRLGDLLRKYSGCDGHYVVPGFQQIANGTAKNVPRSTLHFEEAAYACAMQVDAWRSGRGSVSSCKDARELGLYCGSLLDYWLNFFAARSSGLTSRPPSKPLKGVRIRRSAQTPS